MNVEKLIRLIKKHRELVKKCIKVVQRTSFHIDVRVISAKFNLDDTTLKASCSISEYSPVLTLTVMHPKKFKDIISIVVETLKEDENTLQLRFTSIEVPFDQIPIIVDRAIDSLLREIEKVEAVLDVIVRTYETFNS